MDDEGYERLLAAITVLQEAIIDIAKSLPQEAQIKLIGRLGEICKLGEETPYGASRTEMANGIAKRLSGLG